MGEGGREEEGKVQGGKTREKRVKEIEGDERRGWVECRAERSARQRYSW